MVLLFLHREFRKILANLSAVVALTALLTSPTPQAVAVYNTAVSPTCSGLNCKYDFFHLYANPDFHDYFTWTAPQSGTYIFEAWGAQGGSAESTVGAKGGYAKGELSLTVGDSFQVFVGGAGTASGSSLSDRRKGGYNGGGDGYNGSSSDYRAAGGGGGTDFRTIWNSLYTRQIVAGGGGGAFWMSGQINYPGAGGGLVGETGTASVSGGVSANGGGGSQTAGGAGGAYFTTTNPGTFGLGGNGTLHEYGTPGGGGGWYGGGAGGATKASGGGSSYLGYMNNVITISGSQSMPQPDGTSAIGRAGNGYARISYLKTATAISFSLGLPDGVTQLYKGVKVALTATTSQAGKITFYADGRKIPGCISLPSSIGSKSCDWKPTLRKSVLLTARFNPTSVLYLPASSQVTIDVSQRATLR